MYSRSAIVYLTAVAVAVLCLLNVASAARGPHSKEVTRKTMKKAINRHHSKKVNKLNRRGHHDDDDDDDDDEVFEGKATWFIPHKHHGEIGACGEYEADDDWIVAMNADQYGDMDEVSDDVCFRKVRIYHDGKSVDATVTDACPSCDYGDLDLTQVVFQELGKLKTGVLDITWEFLN